MLQFETTWFAIAGMLAALGPILIHLQHRRRYRTVSWAAMEFLQMAFEQNARGLRLRDIFLLFLRVVAVLCFGIALARPYFQGNRAAVIWQGSCLTLGILGLFGAMIYGVVAADRPLKKGAAVGIGLLGALVTFWSGASLWSSRASAEALSIPRYQPVHAIVLIDNSQSMGTEFLGTTLLDQAKQKAKELLATLPAGSRISVIPTAKTSEAPPAVAYRHRDEAEHAIDRLTITDLAGNFPSAMERALQAANLEKDLTAKRAVLLTDLQRTEFRAEEWTSLLEPLGGLQIVSVSNEPAGNVWLSEFHLLDGIASVDTPCRFVARLESTASNPTTNVLLRLSLDGREVLSQTVELSPGQQQEFVLIGSLKKGVENEQTSFVFAELNLQCDTPAADRLSADNHRWLMIPTVTSLPVIFIDEQGDRENVRRNRIGETYALRHLLSPRSAGSHTDRSLIRVVHVRPEEVTDDLLNTARLVVIAGVERPDAVVSVLREYVRRGGPLMILAGGNFDPLAWQESAWLQGNGLLPVPLKPEYFGATPLESQAELQPFFVDASSLKHDFFRVEQDSLEHLTAIFDSTPFFKAVQADIGWQPDSQSSTTNQSAESALEERQPPHVLAQFRGVSLPYVIERKMGAGRVVLITSGVTSDWNLLRASGAMYYFHRMVFQLIQETFPPRNFVAGQHITLPIASKENVQLQLTRPNGQIESLPVETLTTDHPSVEIRSTDQSGAYHVRLDTEQSSTNFRESTSISETEWTFAVNGPIGESDLTSISPEELTDLISGNNIRVLREYEAIDWHAGAIRGPRLWKEFAWGVFAALIAEMLFLGWTMLSRPLSQRSFLFGKDAR